MNACRNEGQYLALGYEPGDVRPGILHVGLGNFAKAFIGDYTNELAQAGFTDWGFIGVAPSDRQKRDLQTLAQQDNLYTLIKQNGTETCQQIGTMVGAMIGRAKPGRVVDAMVDDSIRVVTLTVTQAGYCLDGSNQFVVTPQLQNEIEAIKNRDYGKLQTVPGWIVAGLNERMRGGKNPFTVVSCDNLPRNGDLTKNIVLSLAQEIDPDLARYLVTYGAFPNTMVDRITPHQNYGRNAQHLADSYKVCDSCAVVCEPYKNWVIEDKFTEAGRPPLDAVGVRFVHSIEPFEDMKLRLLNGSHMSIGLLGKLLQVPTVLDATKDQHIHDFWIRFLRQATTPLHSDTFPVWDYKHDTVTRLTNPHLTDGVDRLVAATTSKVHPRLLNSPAILSGQETGASAFAIAAWLRYMQARDESGNPFNLHEKDVGQIERLGLQDGPTLKDRMADFLASKDPVTEHRGLYDRFAHQVVETYQAICDKGLRPVMQLNFGS